MPGSQEFSQRVEGAQGGPVATSTTGTVETDNYHDGGPINVTTYPTTIDPAATIQELVVTSTGSGITADLVTDNGTAINGVELQGATIALDTISLDSVTFNDPNASGVETHGMWIGE